MTDHETTPHASVLHTENADAIDFSCIYHKLKDADVRLAIENLLKVLSKPAKDAAVTPKR